MLISQFRRFGGDESGATLAEYALLGALIAVVCVAIITATGLNTLNLYTVICNAVRAVMGGPAC